MWRSVSQLAGRAPDLESEPFWLARFAGRRGCHSGDGKGYERSVAEPQECGVRAPETGKPVADCSLDPTLPIAVYQTHGSLAVTLLQAQRVRRYYRLG